MPTYNGDFAGIQSDVDKDIVETDYVSVPRNNEHISCASSDVNEDVNQYIAVKAFSSTPYKSRLLQSILSSDVPQDVLVDHAFIATENESSSYLDQCLINVVSVAMQKKNQQLSSLLSDVHQDVVDMATPVCREKKKISHRVFSFSYIFGTFYLAPGFYSLKN